MAIYYDYIPYFYIIQDVRNGMYYAGSKYGRDANPSNFMIEGGYETSSEKIKKIIKEHGIDNFIIRKLKTFGTGPEAHNYETRFLQKIDARNHPRFYNGHNNDGIRPLMPDEMKKIMNEKYGVDHAMEIPEIKQKALENLEKAFMEKYGVRHNFAVPEVRKTIIITNRKRYGVDHYAQTPEWLEKTIITNNKNFGVDWPSQSEEVMEQTRQMNNETYGVDYWSQTDEAKEILRQAAKKQFSDPIKKEKHRVASAAANPAIGAIWINKNKINKRIYPRDFRQYENAGWSKGRFIEKENAFWDYDKTGSNNPFFGKKHNEDTLNKMSNNMKEKYENAEYKEKHRMICIEKNKQRYNSVSGKIIWVNNGYENKRIGIEHYDPSTGWIRGRIVKRKKK